jgi:hypothetical protein
MLRSGSSTIHLNLPHHAADQALYAPLKFRAQDLRRRQARRMGQRFDIHVQRDGELKAMAFHFGVLPNASAECVPWCLASGLYQGIAADAPGA